MRKNCHKHEPISYNTHKATHKAKGISYVHRQLITASSIKSEGEAGQKYIGWQFKMLKILNAHISVGIKIKDYKTDEKETQRAISLYVY